MSHEEILLVSGNNPDLVAGAETLDAKATASLSLANEVLAGKASSHVPSVLKLVCFGIYGCKSRTLSTYR
jgi:hypothetical protein